MPAAQIPRRERHEPAPGLAARPGLLPAGAAMGIERAGGLLLVARTLAEGVYQGRHRTPDRGASTEFFDYRPYVPGDPTHLVDWRLWGRSDRLYIRRYRQEAQLTVMLVVDGSASMDFAGVAPSPGAPTKLRRAQELAAALAYLTVRQGDRVGLIATGHAPADRRVVRAASGWGALHAVVASLESLRAAGGRAGAGEPDAETPNLAAGLRLAAAVNPRRGLVIAIGDALDDAPAFLRAAGRLRYGAAGSATSAAAGAARGSEVALVQVLTDDELDLGRLAASGPARLRDVERGTRVRTDPRAVAASYNELIRAHVESLRAGMLNLLGRYALCRTSAGPMAALRALLTPHARP